LNWAGKSDPTPADGVLRVWLGEIYAERNQLSQADAQVELAWPQARHGGYLELIKNGCILRARIYRAAGNLPAAIAALEDELEILQRTDARSLLLETRSMLAWYQAEFGQFESALTWLESSPLRAEDHLPSVSTGFQRLNLARAALLVGHGEAALSFSQAFAHLTQTSGSLGWQIEALLIQAQAYARAGQSSAAQSTCREALALAQAEGYVRLFVDGGNVVQDLLKTIYPTLADPGLARYTRRILETFSPEQDFPKLPAQPFSSGPSEPLSEREIQVLRLLSLGMTNQEIADQLVISLATVKTHLRHIFEKLNAQNRVDAIVRAKAVNLL
jgi:LuxR family maltose regulon positive regulatory protein